MVEDVSDCGQGAFVQWPAAEVGVAGGFRDGVCLELEADLDYV